ncbi:Alpha beta hydrolase fold protein [Neofusicoccum parvum]|nr:Alpha beta hydrolase fold protein [Neofusicoccum parvum]
MPADQIGLLSDPALQTNWTKTTCGSEIFSYLRPPTPDAPISEKTPLLILLHGYPQTSFIFRHLLKLLPAYHPLFIPDLPGYGRSTPSRTAHDKLTIGLAILEALSTLLPTPHHPTPIILLGHDRGARIAHRLSLHLAHPSSHAPTTTPLPTPYHLHGLALLDTIPEPAQWASFAAGGPAAAASSFHWPFLANAPLAADMIVAYGGPRWCRALLARWSGGDSSDLPPGLAADGAVEAYAAAFAREEVVRATCADYAASVGADAEMQRGDEREGRRVGGLEGGRGVLVVFSEGYLGRGGGRDVGAVWRGYVEEGTRLVARGIGGGVGHFLVEEAPEEVVGVLVEWLEGGR